MKNKSYVLWILLAIVILLWVLYPFILDKYISPDNDKAEYGNSFGALETLFSGFAFAALVYTIIQQNIQLRLQKEELTLQRKELELTRIELSRTASAQESTEKSIKNQAVLMEYSSRLEGLKILLESYRENSISKQTAFIDKEKYKQKAKKIEKDIEQIYDKLDKLKN